MAMYWKEITVNWGESDPFGLVYYPRIVAWFNDTEHELFRIIGYPIEQMIKNDRTTFVMGEIHFRFIGPAAYGDRILTTITLADIGDHTLHWNCKAKNAVTGAAVSEGRATRVYARINEDGTLNSANIPARMRKALLQSGRLSHLSQKIEQEPEYRHPGRGHLQCQRDSVQAPADLAQQRQLFDAAREAMVGRAGPLDEQGDCALMQVERVAVQRQGQWLDSLHPLALDAQCLLARHQ